MRPDSLEQFILDQRPAFDTEVPAASVWSKIQSDLDGDGDLEIFIRDKREEFDQDTPPSHLWNQIEAELAPAKSQLLTTVPAVPKTAKTRSLSSRYYRFSAAAAVALLVAASFLIGRNSGIKDTTSDYLALIEQIQPDFSDTEAYFQAEITEKYEQVSLYNDDPQLRQDLSAIDESMEEIKAELSEVPLEERADLVNDLIESYRIKLHILERILKHLPSTETETAPQNLNNHDNATEL